MPAVLAILMKLPWKWIGLALAVLALAVLLWKAPWAYSRGAHSRDAEVAQLQASIATLQSNQRILQGSIKSQDDAIAQMQAEAAAKAKAASDALAQAKKDAAQAQATSDALRKSAGLKHAANDPCTISKTLAGAKL